MKHGQVGLVIGLQMSVVKDWPPLVSTHISHYLPSIPELSGENRGGDYWEVGGCQVGGGKRVLS